MSPAQAGSGDPGSPRLLTVADVAEILNVPADYVRRRLVFERRLPYVKVGRHLRIDEQDLRAFIDRGRVSAGRYNDSMSEPRKTWRTSGD